SCAASWINVQPWAGLKSVDFTMVTAIPIGSARAYGNRRAGTATSELGKTIAVEICFHNSFSCASSADLMLYPSWSRKAGRYKSNPDLIVIPHAAAGDIEPR